MRGLKAKRKIAPRGFECVASLTWQVALVMAALGVLSGCGMSTNPPTTTLPPVTGQALGLNGRVHGGQQPVSGSTIQLWQVGTTSYGVGAAPLGSSTTTDANGAFSITGDYSCANGASGGNTSVYITATGGNPGLAPGTNNSALMMMSALGPCGNLTPSTFIWINEVSTTASVYALAQFMGPSGGIGSYASSSQGLVNAFATVNNLVDTSTGIARTKTPAGNGSVPQAEINTLADILAPCVNSSGPTSSSCGLLFGSVSPLSGGAPNTTLGAALSIALNPAFNVSQLLFLTTPNSPFQPTLTTVNDWTLALGFSAGGTNPASLAVDGTGNVWIANHGSGGATSTVSMVTTTGVPALNSPYSNPNVVNGISALAVDQSNTVWLANYDSSTAAELSASLTGGAYSIGVAAGPYATPGLSAPTSVAVDAAANVWFTNGTSNSLTELNHSNYAGASGNFSNVGLGAPRSIAFDNSDFAWVSNASTATVTKLNVAVSPITSANYPSGGLAAPAGIAIDGYSNVWLTDSSLSGVAELNSGGGLMSPTGGFSGGGVTGSSADAIDGSGNLWVADATGNRLSEFSPAGVAISPVSGYLGGSLFAPSSVALDASGNIWLANGNPLSSGGLTFSVTEFIGLASPAIVPLSQAVKQGQLGQRPGTPASNSSLSANAGGPYIGTAGQVLTFDGSKSSGPASQVLTYGWNFGDGGTAAGVAPSHSYAASGTFPVTLTVTGLGGTTSSATTSATIAAAPAPTISGFSPASGPIGTVVTLSGSNLLGPNNTVPQVLLNQQGGSTLNAPVSASSATSLSFVIPPGAATGPVALTVGTQTVSSTSAFTVTTSSSFTVSLTPGMGTLIPGQSTALAVTVNSTNGFSGLAGLSVSGLPSGVTGAFQPSSVAAGQVAVLTLSAPAAEAVGTSTLTVTATAPIDGQTLSQSANASLKVVPVSTSFAGRTVVDDAQNTPIGGVTVKFVGTDDKGNRTGCSGQTVSDGAGNFLLSGLPAACIGPQLISYDGTTATSPAGRYAGVNLSYTLVSGQVVSSPVLVHLPRIDNAETVQVQQNATTDQVFTFSSIPGLQVTVYAGTTIALDDGSKPNPFPLTAMDIPLDRLPEQIATSGMLMGFVVAFQPANATASQPVAVVFPNPLNVAPRTGAALTTLDPTRGYMVPYGTTTVASDGRTFIPDLDPTHPGHRYGLVHFDWHSPLLTLLRVLGISPEACNLTAGGPVDIASGIETYTSTDIQIRGGRGTTQINRTYRTLSSDPGPFGVGTAHNYSVALNTVPLLDGQGIVTLIMPNGNQYPLSITPDNVTFINTVVPVLHGARLAANVATGLYTLRWGDGTTYTFSAFANIGSGGAFLTSITDLNGNTTTLTRNPSQPLQLLVVTDPVGRNLNFRYDGSNRITQISDPIGRLVKYTYNTQGTLAAYTDANGGTTNYTYDSNNNLFTITDPRGVVTEQNAFNEKFDGRISQQVEADGGVYTFAYTLQNPSVPTSPILQTVVTDPLGNQTTYRFDSQGFLLSALDPMGQIRTLTHDTNNNNLVISYSGSGVAPVCGNPQMGNIGFTFDQFGNKLTQTDSLGNTFSFNYDLRFNKARSITDSLNNTETIVYDASGNPVSFTDGNGHTSQFAYDSFGELIQYTDASGAVNTIIHDSFGNVSSINDPVGRAITLGYDAVSRLTSITDSMGRTRKIAYDSLDRVTSRTDPNGHQSTYAYNEIGNITTYTDARGNSHTFSYDPMGRLMSHKSPLGPLESYQYDQNSNPIRYTDRIGQISTYKYDSLNRLVQETYPDATVQHTYDANSRLVAVSDSAVGTFNFRYDSSGRLLEQDEPTGSIKYERDALGRIVARQVIGQGAANYKYDSVGNVLGASMPGASVTYSYEARNLPTTLSRSNGVTTRFSFDQVGRVLSIVHTAGSTSINAQTYAYDASGSRSTVSNDLSQSLSTPATTSTLNNANELLTKSQVSYTYDANGNRQTEVGPDGTRTYIWDGRNRLTKITDSANNSTSLVYDFAGNLLTLTQSAGGVSNKQAFTLDNLSNIVSITSSSSGPLSLLTGMSSSSQFAIVDASGKASYGIEDALGSTQAVTNSLGSLISKNSYEPYGEPTSNALSSYPFTFLGRIPILNNLEYLQNRFYDTAAGSFISEDPFGIQSNEGNLYRYSFSDPVDFADPVGLFAFGGTEGFSGELGRGPFGGGVATQGQVGAGFFFPSDGGPASIGVFGSGAAVAQFGDGTSYYAPDQGGVDPWVLGVSLATPGIPGGFISNANDPSDLRGKFCAFNLTYIPVSLSLQVGYNSKGEEIAILGAGIGAGISVSRYTTNTFATGTITPPQFGNPLKLGGTYDTGPWHGQGQITIR